MKFKAESLRRYVIGDARQAIAQAAGQSGPGRGQKLLSKAEEKTLTPDLRRSAAIARQAKGKGATLTVNEVVDQYAAYVSKVFGAVNTKGPAWLSLTETSAINDAKLRERVTGARAAIAAPKALSAAQLSAIATDFVIEHAEPTDSGSMADAPYLWNGVNSGEEGLTANLIGGAEAQRLIDFTKLARPGKKNHPLVAGFDQKKHDVIAVSNSFDEEDLYVSVIDKSSGQVAYIDQLWMVDTMWFIGASGIDSILPDWKSTFGVDDHEDVDHYQLIDVLARDHGKRLDIGNTVNPDHSHH